MLHMAGSGLLDSNVLAELQPETLNKINRRLMISMRSRDMGSSGAVPVIEGGGIMKPLTYDASGSGSGAGVRGGRKANATVTVKPQQAIAEAKEDRLVPWPSLERPGFGTPVQDVCFAKIHVSVTVSESAGTESER